MGRMCTHRCQGRGAPAEFSEGSRAGSATWASYSSDEKFQLSALPRRTVRSPRCSICTQTGDFHFRPQTWTDREIQVKLHAGYPSLASCCVHIIPCYDCYICIDQLVESNSCPPLKKACSRCTWSVLSSHHWREKQGRKTIFIKGGYVSGTTHHSLVVRRG